jgi:catalase
VAFELQAEGGRGHLGGTTIAPMAADKESAMPLPSDEKLIALGEKLLEQFQTLFGAHPGFRPAHAKGLLLSGTFTPSPDAVTLTRAPHATRTSTPVTVRFSDGTGLPMIPDNIPNANPRGCAIRFRLAEHVHTDIISHSINGFPARTGQEFLEFLRAVGSGDPSSFLAAHPAAASFLQPAPTPSSFAREAYFGISALRFTNRDRLGRYGRYQIVPDAGVDLLEDTTAKTKGASFLFDELARRITAAPVGFQIMVQIANENDVVDDATIQWPADRRRVTFGQLALTAIVPENAREQKTIIFDPIPRVDGIEPSDDPLFELRAAAYLISGRRRRQAPDT